ncbi:MAG: adenylate/guanylate cyclase domain-containing protein [Pseudomonadota bacterium]
MTSVVLVVVGVFSMLAWDTGHEAIDQSTRLLATEVARSVEDHVDELLERPALMVGRLSEQLKHIEPDERKAALREALVFTRGVSFVTYVGGSGSGFSAVRTKAGVAVETVRFQDPPAWFSAAAQAEGPLWSSVRRHDLDDALVMEVARAVRDDEGGLMGVLAGGFRIDRLESLLAEFAADHGAIAFLSDPEGELLASHEAFASMDGEPRRLHQVEHPVIAAVAREVHTLDVDRRVVVNGESYDAFAHEVAHRLPEHWRLLIAVPRSRFQGPLIEHLQAVAVLAVFALIGAFGLALFIGRSTARPLSEVAGGAGRIRDGEFEVDFPPQRVRELQHLSDSLRSMVGGLRERDRMKDAFARYVSPRLVDRVASDPEALRPGGRLMQAVIVFTDLRGFTALTERLGPVETVALINRYLEAMMAVSDAHGGFITDLMGDGLLIAFGIGDEANPAHDAVRCMLAMQQALEDLNRECKAETGTRLEMGAGAHMGEVIVGNIGSASHIKYGVVGDAVNTAARVEALTVGGEVLVSESIYRACGDALEVEPPREVPVKGKREPLRVYSVQALHGPQGLSLPGAEPVNWIAVDVTGRAWRLTGKVLADESMGLRIVAAEERYLLVECSAPLAVHDDLRIDVGTGTLYGRVRQQEGPERWLVRWTGGAQDPVALLQEAGTTAAPAD